MSLFHALILSFVEGITEFLPISSTGHMVLVSEILKIQQTDFVKTFEILIQPGAILAVIVLYYKKLFNTKIWPQLLAAFLPAAVIGFLFFKIIKSYLLGNDLVTVAALFIGGIAFIAIEYFQKKDKRELNSDLEKITIKNAFIIGLFQSVSVIPGVSRSGATILGGLILGNKRKVAAEFSFILAIPTMLAASALDLVKTNFSFTSNEIVTLIIGFIFSFLVALTAIKLLMRFLSNHDFTYFGIYRIIVAVIFFLIFLR